ncbi:MAG: hypothetical protein HPY64_00705 [Anaerolineae bacterium]|nr:hypothetical protein [Anaerolineae bacterium]
MPEDGLSDLSRVAGRLSGHADGMTISSTAEMETSTEKDTSLWLTTLQKPAQANRLYRV